MSSGVPLSGSSSKLRTDQERDELLDVRRAEERHHDRHDRELVSYVSRSKS